MYYNHNIDNTFRRFVVGSGSGHEHADLGGADWPAGKKGRPVDGYVTAGPIVEDIEGVVLALELQLACLYPSSSLHSVSIGTCLDAGSGRAAHAGGSSWVP